MNFIIRSYQFSLQNKMSGRPGGNSQASLYAQRLQRARTHNNNNIDKTLKSNSFVKQNEPTPPVMAVIAPVQEIELENKSKSSANPVKTVKKELTTTRSLKIKVKSRGKEKVIASINLGRNKSTKEDQQFEKDSDGERV